MQNGSTGSHLSAHPSKILGNILMLALIVVVTGFFGRVASAEELSLLVNGKAFHINPVKKNLNENNWGAGVEYRWSRENKKWTPFATASGFKDSNKNMSYYAGGGLMHRWKSGNLHFDAGAVVFAMVRKNFKNDRPFLCALPMFSVGTERVSVNITYIPRVEPKAVPLVFFQLKITLKNL